MERLFSAHQDVGNEFDFITEVRDALNSGIAVGPHMLLASVVDGDGEESLGLARAASPAEAEMWVKKYHNAGFQQIKIYSSMKLENLRAVCRDAHSLGMTVTGHVPDGITAFEARQRRYGSDKSCLLYSEFVLSGGL